MGFKATWLGEGDRYNYGSMCVPTYPCKKQNSQKINFYSKGMFPFDFACWILWLRTVNSERRRQQRILYLIMGFKSTWIGEGDRYNYGQMCIPTYPCKKEHNQKINFYSKGMLFG